MKCPYPDCKRKAILPVLRMNVPSNLEISLMGAGITQYTVTLCRPHAKGEILNNVAPPFETTPDSTHFPYSV